MTISEAPCAALVSRDVMPELLILPFAFSPIVCTLERNVIRRACMSCAPFAGLKESDYEAL